MTQTCPNIGGDPEFFILERKKKAYEVITADKVLPSKDNKQNAGGGTAFFDGVQAEINPRPNQCREFFARDSGECMRYVYNKAKMQFPRRDIVIAPLASVDVTKKELRGADSECFRFGCSPDFNIYTEEPTKYPDCKKFMTRFSGGHVHLGFGSIDYMKKMKKPKNLLNLVRMMDTIAGIISVTLSKDDGEILRRSWYGKAGTYRIQEHGVEYRTLSSFWLVSPILLSLMTGLVRDAFTIVYRGLEKDIFDKVDSEYIRSIIDNSNVEEAKNIYNEVLKPFYKSHNIENSPFKYDSATEVIEKMIDEGYTTYFSPYNTIHYWNIKAPTLVPNNDITHFGLNQFSKNIKSSVTRLNKINKEV